MRCEKVYYSTRADAKAALKRINKLHNTDKKLTDVYLCDKCNHWHLTSMNKKKARAIRRHGIKPKQQSI